MRFSGGGDPLPPPGSTDRNPMIVQPASGPLAGSIRTSPDKSITHRLLFFAAMNRGRTIIGNPSLAADCASTLGLLRSAGYGFQSEPGRIICDGSPSPRDAWSGRFDCGNSGTTARLAAGFLTGERGRFLLDGDESLRRRPMERVAGPLRLMGAEIATAGGSLPLTIDAAPPLAGPLPGTMLDVSSAQVHAALVIAAIRSALPVAIRRVAPMRDHTLRIARLFGLEIGTEEVAGCAVDTLESFEMRRDIDFTIPGDLSSAAFIIAAAMLVPGSRVRIERVGLNPTRIALLGCLQEMGGNLSWTVDDAAREPVGSIDVSYSPGLAGIALGGDDASVDIPGMIDELPLLALIGSQAEGITTVRGAAELRLKESDRISATAAMLRGLGIRIDELADGFSVAGPQRVAGGVADHHGDHRLCMTAAVAALVADGPVTIPSPGVAAVSYPGFWDDLRAIGAPAGEETA
ncbi:MAG: aroA [Chlorobi bacterium]|nr:aroA [Chlorobiota bacterium]